MSNGNGNDTAVVVIDDDGDDGLGEVSVPALSTARLRDDKAYRDGEWMSSAQYTAMGLK